MALLQKVKAIWQKIGLVQQVLLSAIVLTFVLAGAMLLRWASKPDMRMLYQDLGPEEASSVRRHNTATTLSTGTRHEFTGLNRTESFRTGR